MDFKGITWMGNVYQKFEAMCLEMEEVMYQDSVKYMENQAQKVGVCVKKFYSEVMEDFIPSCGVDPLKVSSGDLSLNPYADADINKKPLLSVCDSHGLCKENVTEDKDVPDLITEKGLFLSRQSDEKSFSRLSLGELNQNKSYESSCGKSKKLGAYRRPIGIRRISQTNDLSKDSSRTTSLYGDRNINLASCGTRNNSVIASAPDEVMSSSNLDEKLCPEAVEENTATTRIQLSPLIQKKEVSAEPARLKEGSFKDDASFSISGSSIRNGGGGGFNCSLESVNQATAPSEGKAEEDGFRNTGGDTYDTEFRDEYVFSDEDNYDLEVIEPIMGSNSEANLDKSCVMVERYKFDCDDPQVTRRKSYKKKLCKAVSSKLRLTTRKEDAGGERRIGNAAAAEERNLGGRDSLGSDEWELV